MTKRCISLSSHYDLQHSPVPPLLLTPCLIDQVHLLMRSLPLKAGQTSCLSAWDLLAAVGFFVADFMPYSPLH